MVKTHFELKKNLYCCNHESADDWVKQAVKKRDQTRKKKFFLNILNLWLIDVQIMSWHFCSYLQILNVYLETIFPSGPFSLNHSQICSKKQLNLRCRLSNISVK